MMPTPVKFKAQFYSECFYHLVCKSIDGLLLFPEESDFLVYKKRFKQFTSPTLSLWSYSLLDNHSHHIARVNPKTTILENLLNIDKEQRTVSMNSFLTDFKNEKKLQSLVERQMNSFLISYSNYFNNKYNRKGGIFQSPFRRSQITEDDHLQQAVIYVHANAQKHRIISDFSKYKHSSYQEILSLDPTFVSVNDVIEFFGSKENFIQFHQTQVDHFYSNNWPTSKLE